MDMKINKNKKSALLILVGLVMLILTGCKGEKIDKNVVKVNYNKRIESIEVTNEYEESVYVSFYIVLLDKENEILVKKDYEDKEFSEGQMFSVDLEDIKPEWVEFDRVDSMDAEITDVFGEDHTKNTIRNVLVTLLIILMVILLWWSNF